MKKLLLSIFLLSIFSPVTSQKYYDSNDLKYYIDFSNRSANLKFQDYKIKAPIEEIISFYGNRYTVVRGDSIHWLLQQSEKRNKYLSYLIFKGDYGEVQKLAKWEYSNKKLPIIGVGGIMSSDDAIEKLNAGASLIQVYTGFIYNGPSFVRNINKEIIKSLN